MTKGMSGHSRLTRRASRVVQPLIAVNGKAHAGAGHRLPDLADGFDIEVSTGRPPTLI